MRFCHKCNTKLTQNSWERIASICPRCNPEKIVLKKPIKGENYSGKTKLCSKGCGTKIYWDENFKSTSDKFIPMDSKTNEPHKCKGPENPGLIHYDKIEE